MLKLLLIVGLINSPKTVVHNYLVDNAYIRQYTKTNTLLYQKPGELITIEFEGNLAKKIIVQYSRLSFYAKKLELTQSGLTSTGPNMWRYSRFRVCLTKENSHTIITIH